MAVEKISNAHKMKSVAKMFGVFWIAKVSLAISPTHLVSCISNMCVMSYTSLFFSEYLLYKRHWNISESSYPVHSKDGKKKCICLSSARGIS